jgi:hypothetical protein
MTNNVVSRRWTLKALTYGAAAGTGLVAFGPVAFGQDFGRARDMVDRVQEDLRHAAEFTRTNEKERVRYENVQHHLSEFDRELRRDHFDKGKLDTAIDDLKNVVQNNTLEGRERDALASDLSDLRTLRDVR